MRRNITVNHTGMGAYLLLLVAMIALVWTFPSHHSSNCENHYSDHAPNEWEHVGAEEHHEVELYRAATFQHFACNSGASCAWQRIDLVTPTSSIPFKNPTFYETFYFAKIDLNFPLPTQIQWTYITPTNSIYQTLLTIKMTV